MMPNELEILDRGMRRRVPRNPFHLAVSELPKFVRILSHRGKRNGLNPRFSRV